MAARLSMTLSCLLALPPLLGQTSSLQLRQARQCPPVWKEINADLTGSFVGDDGECTNLARASIRFAFHDAATFSGRSARLPPASGGADGSLLLSAEEIGRRDNAGLEEYHRWLTAKFDSYKARGVGAADLIQFASNHAIVSCPGGPTVKTMVGRQDSALAASDGLLPAAFGNGSDHDSLVELFCDKGFDAVDLAALVGAHSTAKVFHEERNGVPVGAALDSTPGRWDVKFYKEMLEPCHLKGWPGSTRTPT